MYEALSGCFVLYWLVVCYVMYAAGSIWDKTFPLELVHCHQEIHLVKEVLFTLKYALRLSKVEYLLLVINVNYIFSDSMMSPSSLDDKESLSATVNSFLAFLSSCVVQIEKISPSFARKYAILHLDHFK